LGVDQISPSSPTALPGNQAQNAVSVGSENIICAPCASRCSRARGHLPAEKRRRTVDHRESSGAVWRAWSMDRRKECPPRSPRNACDDHPPSFPARIVGRAHLGALPEHLALALFILTQNGQNVTRPAACYALQVEFQI